MSRGISALLIAGFALTATGPARAVPLALSGEIQYSPVGEEATTAELARMPDGGFVAAWYACVSDCSQDVEARAQVFDAQAAPASPVIEVNQQKGAIQIQSSVATDAQGNFVVTWLHNNGAPDYDDHRVYGRRFDAGGDPLGDEFRVDTSGGPYLDDPVVAAAPDGRFVVVWYSVPKVEARLYGSDGQPAGAPFTVEAWGSYNPDVAMRADGSFIVAFSSIGGQLVASGWSASGSKQFGPIEVSDDANGDDTLSHGLPSVAAQADGGFQIAWSRVSDGHATDAVFLRRYDAAGAARGASVQVNETRATGFWPSLGVHASGAATVAWTDRDSAAIVARTFDAQGVADGAPYSVSETAGIAFNRIGVTTRSVLFGDDGRFMIGWWRDADQTALHARFFRANVTGPGEDPPEDDGDGDGSAESRAGGGGSPGFGSLLMLGAAMLRRRRR